MGVVDKDENSYYKHTQEFKEKREYNTERRCKQE